MKKNSMNHKLIIFIGSLASMAAGYIHIFIVGLGHGSILLHLITFMIGGLLQIILGIMIWNEKYIREIFWSSAILHGGFMCMLVFATVFPVPFLGKTESLGDIGLITLLLEVLALACFLFLFIKHTRKTVVKHIILTFCLGVFVGSSAFIFGYMAEGFFPQMKNTDEIHGDHHDH
ncbi:hypothetical protein COB57_02835 [Candidatus Peregrinibacteria bacterium]|nr:MAG: hypothetical protein COB57_02835 [Candidatus Peregrinibacteria bacterium]